MNKYGLIGYPLGHSFSKKYFTQKFQEENIHTSQYELYPLKSIKELPKFIKELPELIGINVTIPYKQEVITFLDEIDGIAEQIGAVNTIKIKDGKLKGYNTDVVGFETSLRSFLMGKPIEKALIFGTGGASKAVIFVLEKMKIDVQLVSRTQGNNLMTYEDLEQLDFSTFQLLINTTPLGTFPNITQCVDIPYSKLTSQHFLYDLVYNPAVTLFMKNGQERGAAVLNGLDMLIGQAEAAWDIWND